MNEKKRRREREEQKKIHKIIQNTIFPLHLS